MQDYSRRELRRTARNFKGKIELMKRTPLKIIEANFLELHEMCMQKYIEIEKNKFPEKTRKEIIIDMYIRNDKLRHGKK